MPYERLDQASQCQCYSAVGKRSCRGPITPVPSGIISSVQSSPSSGSLSLFCRNLKRPFLVDSGADVSVYPASQATLSSRQTGVLSAANGSSIKTFGTCALRLNFRKFCPSHVFTLAEVSKPILGTDFFVKHRLIIDLFQCAVSRTRPPLRLVARRASLPPSVCGLRLPASSPPASPPPSSPSAWRACLESFPDVVDSAAAFDSTKPPLHGIHHVVVGDVY